MLEENSNENTEVEVSYADEDLPSEAAELADGIETDPELEAPDLAYNRISYALALLLGVAAITSLFVALDGGSGSTTNVLRAQFYSAEARIVSEAQARQNYTTYSYYLLNNELEAQLGAAITDFEAPEQLDLVREFDRASFLADSNRFFFPAQYLRPDGSYDLNRDIEERIALRRQRVDIDPEPHFISLVATTERSEEFILIGLLMGLSVGLLGVEKVFYWQRRWLRWVLIVPGVALFVWAFIRYLQIGSNPIDLLF